jgi:NAD-dependent DNA ligase
MSGFEFTSERRKKELQTILNGFGIRMIGEELVVEARPDNFPKKKHSLLQAMLAINDLFVLAPAKVESFFREDVERYLSLHDVRFTMNIDFIGRSGFNQHFDFVIPASKQQPERLLRAISSPRKDTISALLFAWDDVRKVREQESVVIAVLNDLDKPIPDDARGALDMYGITAMPWSQREKFSELLAA